MVSASSEKLKLLVHVLQTYQKRHNYIVCLSFAIYMKMFIDRRPLWLFSHWRCTGNSSSMCVQDFWRFKFLANTNNDCSANSEKEEWWKSGKTMIPWGCRKMRSLMDTLNANIMWLLMTTPSQGQNHSLSFQWLKGKVSGYNL